MLTVAHIKALNIEMSSACIGKCPFCSRDQKVRPYGTHMIRLDDVKHLPEKLLRQLKWISFSGNFGDFSTNPEMVAVAAYIKNLNPDIVLGGDTNGASQDEDWWAALGSYFKNGSMVFSVDGLEDTHARHRVGTHYPKIIRNITAFTRAGGKAHWKFIVFAHNEHQVAQAKAIAGKIGCARFFAIPSRDYNDRLKPPETMKIQIKRDLFHAYDDHLDDAQAIVQCKPFSNGSLYLAADGTVHPCCFAHCMYITEHNHLFDFIPPLAEAYHDQINFKTRPLDKILSSPYFNEILAASKHNAYCRIKCNQFRKTIKKELILDDIWF